MHIGFKTAYFKDLAELEAGNFWFRARNRILLWAIGRYSPAMTSFLEIGCGTGFVISGISKQFPGLRLLGCEYLEEGLIYARARVPAAEFTQMDARCIPYESELDAVGAFDVLEHIEEDKTVLQQIYKALKPCGCLYLSVPQHRWLWSAVDEFACHVRRYGADELHEKVRQAGFEIIRSSSFVCTLMPVMYLSRLLQRNKTDLGIDDLAGLRVNPVLNHIFEWFLRFELALIRAGVTLPVGGSRLLIALKPAVTQKDDR
jgi:SAM-dependent methyltransferase